MEPLPGDIALVQYDDDYLIEALRSSTVINEVTKSNMTNKVIVLSIGNLIKFETDTLSVLYTILLILIIFIIVKFYAN